MGLQRPFYAYLDRGPFFPFPPLSSDFVQAGWTARGGIRFFQPLVQQRLELTHVFEAELQGLEPANSGLGKHISIQRSQGESDVSLSEAQLDPPLLKLLGELLQVVRGRCVLVGVLVVAVHPSVVLLLVMRMLVVMVVMVAAVVQLWGVPPYQTRVHQALAPWLTEHSIHREAPGVGVDQRLLLLLSPGYRVEVSRSCAPPSPCVSLMRT